MLALLGAAPPPSNPPRPRLSLCLHACADTLVRATLSPSSPGTSTRSAASGIGGGGGGDDGGGGGDDDGG